MCIEEIHQTEIPYFTRNILFMFLDISIELKGSTLWLQLRNK